MKKITLALLVMLAFCWQSNAQFTENFDTEIPATWTVLNEDGGTYTWTHQTQYPQAGAGHARIHWEGSAHDDYLISPQFAVTANVSDRISFYAGIDGTFFTETFDVRISTTGATAADFTTTIASETATTDADGDYTQYIYDLSAYNGQNIYVAIVATDTDRFYLYIDEFTVDGVPTCTPPEGTVVLGTTDCGANTFNVDVDVTVLGDGSPVLFDGTTSFPVAATGMFTVGPYASGTPVTFTLQHGSDTQCDVDLGTIVYYCPPVNDDCANAEALTVNADLNCGTVTAGTTVEATASAEDATDVSGTPNNDVWYSFVATDSAHNVSLLNVTAVVGTSTDMGMAVYDATGGCAGLVFEATSDPNSLSLSGLTSGTTYYVRVYGWGATTTAQTTFDVCVGTPPAPPANDECANAEALTVNTDLNCGAVTAGTTVSATASAEDDTSTSGTPNNDVWFSFVATDTAHNVSLLNVSAVVGTSTDMGMAVYDATGGCAALVFEATSDPNTLNLSGLTASTTYFVRVYGWSSSNTATAQTTFDVCVGTPPPPPANDECSGAISISPGDTLNGTTVSATGAGGATSCNGSIGNDVWYQLTGDGGDITIEVIAANEGAQIGIYESSDGTCGGFTEGTCYESVDDLGALTTDITFSSTNGTEYFINLGAWLSSGDDFPFTITASTTLSVDNVDSPAAFTYYPNPVKNTLKLNAQNTIEQVAMYNMLGQEVLRATPNAIDSELDMSNLQTGTYFVKVTIANITKTIRVIKQ